MNITELWLEHSQSPFPKGLGGKDIQGICVTTIDTYVSGCLSTYIGYEEKTIDLEKFQILQRYKKEIEVVLPELKSNDASSYFTRLHEMCTTILSEASIK